MLRREFFKVLGWSSTVSLVWLASPSQGGVSVETEGTAEDLFAGFQAPPARVRPFVRWWWNGNRVREDEILRELDVLKEAGIGGVEINPIETPPASKETADEALTWLSPEWNRMVKIAAEGAEERGMFADLIVGTGWPFGGRFLKPEDTIQGVNVSERELEGPSVFEASVQELLRPPGSNFEFEDSPEPELLFLRLVPRRTETFEAGTNLTGNVQPDGTVRFTVPTGKHTLFTGTWQRSFRRVMHGGPGGDGPVLNHFSASAVEEYLQRVSDALGPVLGDELGDGLRAMFTDSIELSGANWTGDLLEEFEGRRGYSARPYLPFLLGAEEQEQGGRRFWDTIRRVRFDYYRTLAELFQERFVHTFDRWCHQNGTRSRYQAYGNPWLMDMLSGYMIPDIPEGDTWLYNDHRADPSVDNLEGVRYAVWNKYASSGAHLSGTSEVSCESMTNVRGVFRTSLEEIKQADDLNFISGVTHSVLHGFNYSPPEAGFPGWIRYGTYFSEQNSWWPHFRKWADYNARLSWVFQRSTPQVDVAILGPTGDVWSTEGLRRGPFVETPWYLHRLWQAVHQNGYVADYVNESVLQQATFGGGKLRFGPRAYEVLIATNVESVQPATAQALRQFAAAGGRIIFVGEAPNRSLGLAEAEQNDRLVRERMSAVLEDDSNRAEVVEGPEEAVLLEWTRQLLDASGVEPAVEISPPNALLFQNHHQLGARDIFFFTNADREEAVTFEARFATGDKTPWRWDPETGERRVFSHQGGKRSSLSIHLGPLESLLLVFEPEMEAPAEAEAIEPQSAEEVMEINTEWDLRLNPAEGEAFTHELADLASFAEIPALDAFGGTVVYHTAFNGGRGLEDRRVELDLGEVQGITEVTLNGETLGTRWWGQHSYDVSSAVRPGRNELQVELTTVLYNYVRSLEDNPTAQHWTHRSNDESLEPIGLLGPVQLLVYVRR